MCDATRGADRPCDDKQHRFGESGEVPGDVRAVETSELLSTSDEDLLDRNELLTQA
jgi:hypothetical protein